MEGFQIKRNFPFSLDFKNVKSCRKLYSLIQVVRYKAHKKQTNR